MLVLQLLSSRDNSIPGSLFRIFDWSCGITMNAYYVGTRLKNLVLKDSLPVSLTYQNIVFIGQFGTWWGQTGLGTLGVNEINVRNTLPLWTGTHLNLWLSGPQPERQLGTKASANFWHIRESVTRGFCLYFKLWPTNGSLSVTYNSTSISRYFETTSGETEPIRQPHPHLPLTPPRHTYKVQSFKFGNG